MKARSEVLRRVVRNTFWDAYDHLGTLVACNLLWFLLCLPVVTIPLATAGMLRVTYEAAVRREASVGDFFRGMLALWLPSTALILSTCGIVCLAVLNIMFYAGLAAGHPFLGVALAALCFWVVLGWVCVMQFAVPAAVEWWDADSAQHQSVAARAVPQAERHFVRLGFAGQPASVTAALKVGLLLLTQAPAAACAALLSLLCFWGLCVATGVGLVLVAAGVSCLALHHLYRETVAELTGLGDRRSHERRSLGELLRPWDEGKAGQP